MPMDYLEGYSSMQNKDRWELSQELSVLKQKYYLVSCPVDENIKTYMVPVIMLLLV